MTRHSSFNIKVELCLNHLKVNISVCVIWICSVVFETVEKKTSSIKNIRNHYKNHCRSCYARVVCVGNRVYLCHYFMVKKEEALYKVYLCMHACTYVLAFSLHDDIANVMDFCAVESFSILKGKNVFQFHQVNVQCFAALVGIAIARKKMAQASLDPAFVIFNRTFNGSSQCVNYLT